MKLSNFVKYGILFVCLAGTMSPVFASISTDARVQYDKGINYYEAGQYKEAARCFKQAVEYDPNYIDAYYNLGSILEYLKQDDLALTVFKQIILRKPDDYEAVYKAAQISQKLGQYEKAQMYLTLIPPESSIGQKAQELSSVVEESLKVYNEEKLKQQAESFRNDLKTEYVNQSAGMQGIPALEEPAPEEEKPVNITYSNLPSPTGIALDKDKNLYVAGFSDNTIYKITKDNKKIVHFKSNRIDGPIGIAIDSNGNLYIANYNKDNVLRVTSAGVVTEFINNIPKPYCLYILNNMLYVSSQGSNSVIQKSI